MKKVILLVISIVVLIIFLISQNWKIGERELGVVKMSQERIDEKIKGKEFKAFETPITFNGYNIGYDVGQNMLLIPQKINEKFFEGKLVTEEELVFLDDVSWKNKAEALRSNQVFRLYRITDTQYWMYNVYFTGLPVASIDSNHPEEELTTVTQERNGKVWLYDQYRDGLRFQASDCFFHVRGASSIIFPKKSYRLGLVNNKLSFLGMRKDDDWILNSLYDDEGLIHNKLSFDLWQQIASSNSVTGDEGVTMEYLELFLDNTYIGVFGLSERVDKKELDLNGKDKLYKGVGTTEVGKDDFYIELKEGMNPVFEIKYPEEIKEEDWEPLKQWYYNIKNSKNITLEEGYSLLNVENAIDYLLYNLYICNDDNILKNIYYWADYQENGSYKMIKIPWDLGITWGNVWTDNHKFHVNQYDPETVNIVRNWTDDMFNFYNSNPKEVGILIQDRWKDLRKEIITVENIFQLLDQELSYLHSSGARIREELFWGSREEYWKDEYLYEYAEKKILTMDEYISNLGSGTIER